MFVDNSGRRARLLRRIGLLLGAVCLGYAAVLGAAFMGWGTSLTPSQLLPFAGAGPGGGRPEGVPGGPGAPGVRPSGLPSAPAGEAVSGTTSSPSSSPSPSASAGAN
ncbi:hypothetical protein [Streptomyces sp. NRRL S-146]|uniref:hypothetical protein n=1 Tax=Streptomyces sp. NRRL S-146 TaxID=1463884 RepID=UPI000A56C7CB|nr:hypothetical protein [Streptomyces sp. NRRL S-146]